MATAIEHDTTQHLTIHFEEAEDGWVTARIEEEPAAISQGRSRDEAYENVLDALHEIRHRPTFVESLAYALQARVIEPLSALVQQRAQRR
jgi:uncharacterized protein YdaU (DUF1376 family)